MNLLEEINIYTELYRETTMLYENHAQKHGLSYCELLVILSLSNTKESCHQKDICTQWQLPKQTVNTILKTFLHQQWVSLLPLPEDRRHKRILVTPIGKKHFDFIVQDLQSYELYAWERLGKAGRSALLRYSKEYNEHFKEAFHHAGT